MLGINRREVQLVGHHLRAEKPLGDFAHLKIGQQRQNLRALKLFALAAQNHRPTIAVPRRIQRPQAAVHTALKTGAAATAGSVGKLHHGPGFHLVHRADRILAGSFNRIGEGLEPLDIGLELETGIIGLIAHRLDDPTSAVDLVEGTHVVLHDIGKMHRHI